MCCPVHVIRCHYRVHLLLNLSRSEQINGDCPHTTKLINQKGIHAPPTISDEQKQVLRAKTSNYTYKVPMAQVAECSQIRAGFISSKCFIYYRYINTNHYPRLNHVWIGRHL